MASQVVQSEPWPDEPWWVYLIECRDGSLYTGVARDVGARLDAHARGQGARYTRGRGPLRLLGVAGPFARAEALRWEHRWRRWSSERKRAWFLECPGLDP